ncbi:MAG: transcription antitermination factor NusB [bacterium]
MKRRLARELVLKTLFQIDLGKVDTALALETVLEEEDNTWIKEFVRSLVKGTGEHQEKIDQLIEQYSTDWKLDRMAAVDRNLLRLAIYEILYMPDIPSAVSINEAVELAKVYGSDESAKFVNGILGNLVRQINN